MAMSSKGTENPIRFQEIATTSPLVAHVRDALKTILTSLRISHTFVFIPLEGPGQPGV